MKKIYHIILAWTALSLAVSCGGKIEEPSSGIPAVVQAAFTSLEKSATVPGAVNTLPVSATTADGLALSLDFHSGRTYLPAGTYTVGTADGQYTGRVRSSLVEGNIVGGMLTVAVEGEDNYTISGTVRLDNAEATAVKIRAAGSLVYEFAAEYYYTVSKGETANGIKADVYRVFLLDEPYQMAEFAVVGAETGTFTVSGTGAAGTAVYGTAEAGSWVYEDGIGWHNLQHGTVTISDVRGKKTFQVDDTYSATFANCEKKDAMTPKRRSGDDSWTPGNNWVEKSLTSKLFIVESPVAKGMYEYMARIYFPDGREFMSCTFLTPDESSFNKGRLSAVFVDIDGYSSVTAFTAMRPTCYYVIDGVRYGPGNALYVQLYDRVIGDIRAIGLYLFLNANMDMPDPYGSFLGAAASKMFGFMNVE